MAKRRGKAHNRQQRRNQQRAANPRPGAPSPQPLAPVEDLELAAPATSSGGMDAFDRADAEVRAQAAPPLTSTSPRRPKGRAADPRVVVTGTSRLGERAATEYHYVVRDLRNIGVLVLILAALLAAATVAVHALGIGQL